MPHELLVVDDEPKIAEALKAFFEEKGFHVSTAPTIRDALTQFLRTPADIALLDLRLPDGSGLDLLCQLKARQPHLRVVVISGLADARTIEEARQRGANEFLAKPFDFDRCFYAAMGIEAIDLTSTAVEPQALARVPAVIAQRYRVVPIRWDEGALYLAMADPFEVQRVDELKMLLGCPIVPLAIMRGDLTETFNRCYGVGASVSPTFAPCDGRAAIDEPNGVVQLVDELIRQASIDRATDLHLGTGPDGPWIRERIDGVLYNVPVAPEFAALYANVLSRIKVMAKLDIAEHRLPQDGRAWFELGGTKLDLRLSFVPTPHGESLAIRLLEPSLLLHMDQLGMHEEQRTALTTLLAKPSGLLLVTGPTGSGKSTSLYAFLSHLNTGRLNIVTIEDPIEHELPGLTQIQVQPKIGLTFATGLRSMLRHDPDIIMVGEIRDQDTAQLAVRAALTGHLVLSTLHTIDAASGITRLLDLGIEPFLLCSTLLGVLSQRLLRQLCMDCRTTTQVDVAELRALGLTPPAETGAMSVAQTRGCQACRRTGYHGRTGAFEVLPIDYNMRSLIIKRTSGGQLRQSAMARGMRSLWHVSWQKVQAGLTSLDELTRVLPQELR